MPSIDVVRASDLTAGDSTPGIVRGKAFDAADVLVSETRLDGKAVSGWHHHGTRHLYGFLAAGRVRFEYGPAGTESVVVESGEFFHVPPHLVHRDVNPDSGRATVVAFLVGRGPAVVNVAGP